MNEGYRFKDENFEVGYQTNNSPWVNISDFWDEDLMPQDHFWNEASFGYSSQDLNITANEDLMPQDHFWTEVPFGYSSQTLNITEGNLIN